jgi:hypothetical protein
MQMSLTTVGLFRISSSFLHVSAFGFFVRSRSASEAFESICSFAHRFMNRLSTKSEQSPVYIVAQPGHDSECSRCSPHVSSADCIYSPRMNFRQVWCTRYSRKHRIRTWSRSNRRIHMPAATSPNRYLVQRTTFFECRDQTINDFAHSTPSLLI